MKTLRLTVIFAVLALGLALIVGFLYSAFKPIGLAAGPLTPDPVQTTIIPIACGLIAAPVTLRLNRWVERRMLSNEKGKR